MVEKLTVALVEAREAGASSADLEQMIAGLEAQFRGQIDDAGLALIMSEVRQASRAPAAGTETRQ